MADLTSTIRITGTVGGKVISYTHTMTVADVVDAGAYHGGAVSGAIPAANAGATSPTIFNLRGPSFDYVFAINDSVNVPALCLLQDVTNVIDAYLLLFPGQMFIGASVATGLFTYNATATTVTLNICEAAAIQNNPTAILKPIGSLMVASTAAS